MQFMHTGELGKFMLSLNGTLRTLHWLAEMGFFFIVMLCNERIHLSISVIILPVTSGHYTSNFKRKTFCHTSAVTNFSTEIILVILSSSHTFTFKELSKMHSCLCFILLF